MFKFRETRIANVIASSVGLSVLFFCETTNRKNASCQEILSNSAAPVRLKDSDDVYESTTAAWSRLFEADKKNNTERSFEVGRFLGFLEGKTGVAIPSNWAQKLQTSTVKHGKLFLGSSDVGVYNLSPNGVGFRYISKGFVIEQSLREIQLVGPNVAIPFKGFSLEKNKFVKNGIDASCTVMSVAEVGKDGLVIGFCDDAPLPFVLVFLDNRGNLVWSSKVACSNKVEDSFSHNSFMAVDCELAVTSTTVFVFGEAYGFGFLEAFDLKNGDNIFRLQTDNVDH